MATRRRTMRRAAVFLVCVLWAFAAYSWVRTRSGPTGLDSTRMGLAFVWSLTKFEVCPPWLILPPAWIVIGLWCGRAIGLSSPLERRLGRPADGRALVVVGAMGWILGCATVESVLVVDEIAFEREARAAGPGYRRNRRWTPMYGDLVWEDTRGWCVDH